MFRRSISRRSLLTAAATAFLIGGARQSLAASGPVFTLGVAAGNPTPSTVVLWTRLAPEPLSPDPRQPGGMPSESVPARWEVASDPGMQRIVKSGSENAEPRFAHALHIECGGLEPDRDYWYRFVAAGEASPVGHFRTAPAAGAATDKMRFGFVSCSNYEFGYFSAYRHLADEAPDLIVFLGDYIYEYFSRFPLKLRAHSDGVAATDLRTYRNRYAQYRTDPDLQRLHATAACLATWDDHEVQNDYADRWSETFDDPQAFLARRAAAYRAYWEHMPLPLSALPRGPNATINGRFNFGDLASFLVVDDRQFRSRLACDRPPKGGGKQVTDAACPERLDPSRSYLGLAQEHWLYDEFRRGTARWNILAQQQLMADLKERLDSGETAHWTEDWNGYPAARQRLLQAMHDSAMTNPVVIGGDIHSFWANDLKLDFNDAKAPAIATEFVGTSITSPGPPYAKFASWLPDNPHIHFFESRKRGYVSVELQPRQMDVAFRTVSDVTKPEADISTLQRFTVEDGHPGVNLA